MIKSILQLTILFILSMTLSCEQNTEDINTGPVFFDDPENIIWKHKVNSIDDLQKYSKLFKGIELDLVYYPERNEFEVEHDPDPNSSIKLMDYFGSIPHPENNYYWLDIKNLKIEYADSLLNRLVYVLEKYTIKENVICESWQMESLKKLNEAGLYTSYWIPDFPYDGEINSNQQKKLDQIIDNLSKCRHNAISAPYQMLPFIQDHLSDCTVHLWTNGLIKESEKAFIKAMTHHENVKVVLVDYDKPF